MEYCYERFCQLCGVSFAIARLRCADEPEEAGWDPTGWDYVKVCNSDEDDRGMSVLCHKGSGCTVSDRRGDWPGEHLAGHGCVSNRGYAGHRISLAEMKGCRAFQCLVKKNADWMPEDDDQDFELEGDYFLSGIRELFPGDSARDIKYIRHGVEGRLIVCFSSALPLLQYLANDGPHRETFPRTVIRSIPHALNYTRKFARCASVELTLKACSVRVM